MEDNLHIYEKLRLEKDADLRRDVFVGNKIVVDGESYFNGTAYFNEKVILNNLDSVSETTFSDSLIVSDKPDILFVDENGQVKKGGDHVLKSLIYAAKPCLEPVGVSNYVPSWAAGVNKIYLQECPTAARVGIGISNPRSKLDVIGTTTTSQLAIGISNPADMVGKFHLKNSSSANSNTIFLIENSERRLMQLNNQGLLNVREVKVDLEAWPDYVFDKNYKLIPLVEVEKFIKLNGHLPNIPNAKTVENEGVNLG